MPVVVPVIGFIAGFAFGLGRAEQIGVALDGDRPRGAACLAEGPALGRDAGFAPTLQIAVAGLALATMPFWVLVGNLILGTNGFVAVTAVIKQVALAQLLPLGLGDCARRGENGSARHWGVPARFSSSQ